MSTYYDFGQPFQKKILTLLWRDSESYSIYREVIEPQFFEKDIHIDLARIIFKYYEKFEKPPTLDVLLEEVRELCDTTINKQAKYETLVNEVIEMSEMPLEDFEYVKEKVIDFGRRQAMTKAILESVEDVKKGVNYDKVQDRIKKATQIGVDIGDLGSDYFEDIEGRLERDYAEEQVLRIPTGIKYLDKIMNGGLAKKELGIVIAPPGRGKTISLVNIGANAVLEGKNVLHLSLEMSEKVVQQRYDNRIVKKNKDYIKRNKGAVAGALARLSKARKGRLIVKEFAPRTCSPETVEALLLKLKIAKGFVPDVLILDYPDLMKPSRTYGERRTELEILYEDCRALGVKYDMAVWGASQANRGSLSKEIVTIADLAESFGKAAVSDFMIAICQTEEEKENNQLRYFVAKHRNGQDSETICCDIVYEQMYIKSNEETQALFEVSSYGDDVKQSAGQHKQTFKQQLNNEMRAENEVVSEIMNKLNLGGN